MESAIIPASTHDAQVIAMWLHGRSAHTQRAYQKDARRFFAFSGKTIGTTMLGDVQAFADSLGDLAPSSRGRAVAAVKSLFAFAHRLGYLPYDVGRPVRLPPSKETLSERILPEAAIVKMLALEENERNRVLLKLLYASGARVSEVCGLCWRDLTAREDAGQITVYGKGAKTRHILLPASVWEELVTLRAAAAGDNPVFRSRQGDGGITPTQALRIVKAAARRAGITDAISPHWLRHAHATHALDRGAAIHLVQFTLGHASVATTGRYLHARPTDSSGRYLAI